MRQCALAAALSILLCVQPLSTHFSLSRHFGCSLTVVKQILCYVLVQYRKSTESTLLRSESLFMFYGFLFSGWAFAIWNVFHSCKFIFTYIYIYHSFLFFFSNQWMNEKMNEMSCKFRFTYIYIYLLINWIWTFIDLFFSVTPVSSLPVFYLPHYQILSVYILSSEPSLFLGIFCHLVVFPVK